MHSSPLELGRKRVELNVRESFKYFTQELLRKYLKKNICNFKSPISPWRGPQWKLLFWAFFLNSLRNPTTQKISFHWAPLLAFPNVWPNNWTFRFLNICCNFLGQKSGVQPCQRSLVYDKYIFFSRRSRTLLSDIFGLKNTLLTTLTYCALQCIESDLRFVKKFTRPDFRAKTFTH